MRVCVYMYMCVCACVRECVCVCPRVYVVSVCVVCLCMTVSIDTPVCMREFASIVRSRAFVCACLARTESFNLVSLISATDVPIQYPRKLLHLTSPASSARFSLINAGQRGIIEQT